MDADECNRLNTLFNGLPTFKELFTIAGFRVQPHVMHVTKQSLLKERNTWHRHQTVEYSLLLAGRTTYHIEDKEFTVAAGDALFIPPGMEHHWEVVEEDSAVFGFMLFITCGGRGGRTQLGRLWKGMEARGFHQPRCRALADIVDRLLETARRGTGYLDEGLRCLSHEAYVELFNTVLPPDADGRKVRPAAAAFGAHRHLRGGSPQTLYETVFYFVSDNAHRLLSPNEVSAYMGLSLNRLNSLMKSHCGRTVGQIIWAHKIDLACNLLDNTNRQVKEIASSLGVEDATYFCRRFRQYTGIAPNGYRLKNRT